MTMVLSILANACRYSKLPIIKILTIKFSYFSILSICHLYQRTSENVCFHCESVNALLFFVTIHVLKKKQKQKLNSIKLLVENFMITVG